MSQRLHTACLVVVICSRAIPAFAQVPDSPQEIFRSWCAQCHGADGTGQVPNPTVKTTPMDFTSCSLSSSEPDADWELVIAQGGPAAGLSSEMPAFGEALDADQVRALVDYLRTFCAETGWPHGNLNFQRPIFTEKAFPENEVIFVPAVSHERTASARVTAIFERRLGKRAQLELALPMQSISGSGSRQNGVGDIDIGGKYVIHADHRASRILTAGFEIRMPSGNPDRGLGAGFAAIEPYLAAGTLWHDTYIQSQLKLELPWRRSRARRELVYNIYVGRDLAVTPDGWTIGVELNGENDEVAVTPQLRKGLTRTGALAVALGVRVPAINREEQHTQWVGYLLWEFLEPVRPRR